MSLWAAANQWKTIGILFLLHLILGAFYLYGGIYLFANGITFPEKIIYLGHGLILLAWACYPFRHIKKGFYKNSYWKRKFWQGVILLASAVYITNIGNQLARSSMMPEASETVSVRPVVLKFEKNKNYEKKQSKKERKLSRKNLKKEFKGLVKKMRKDRKSKGGNRVLGRILLVLLLVFVVVSLASFILVLSCSLACAGHEALAMFALLGGLIFLTWGFIEGLRAIERWGKPKQDISPVSD